MNLESRIKKLELRAATATCREPGEEFLTRVLEAAPPWARGAFIFALDDTDEEAEETLARSNPEMVDRIHRLFAKHPRKVCECVEYPGFAVDEAEPEPIRFCKHCEGVQLFASKHHELFRKFPAGQKGKSR